jgi:hypothetical protein
MKEFAEPGGVVARISKGLGEGDDTWMYASERFFVAVDAEFVGALTGQERRPTRIANGVLAVRAVELESPLGERVEVRRPHRFDAVSVELGPQVVDCYQQDVQRSRRRAEERQGARMQQKYGDQQSTDLQVTKRAS